MPSTSDDRPEITCGRAPTSVPHAVTVIVWNTEWSAGISPGRWLSKAYPSEPAERDRRLNAVVRKPKPDELAERDQRSERERDVCALPGR